MIKFRIRRKNIDPTQVKPGHFDSDAIATRYLDRDVFRAAADKMRDQIAAEYLTKPQQAGESSKIESPSAQIPSEFSGKEAVDFVTNYGRSMVVEGDLEKLQQLTLAHFEVARHLLFYDRELFDKVVYQAVKHESIALYLTMDMFASDNQGLNIADGEPLHSALVQNKRVAMYFAETLLSIVDMRDKKRDSLGFDDIELLIGRAHEDERFDGTYDKAYRKVVAHVRANIDDYDPFGKDIMHCLMYTDLSIAMQKHPEVAMFAAMAYPDLLARHFLVDRVFGHRSVAFSIAIYNPELLLVHDDRPEVAVERILKYPEVLKYTAINNPHVLLDSPKILLGLLEHGATAKKEAERYDVMLETSGGPYLSQLSTKELRRARSVSLIVHKQRRQIEDAVMELVQRHPFELSEVTYRNGESALHVISRDYPEAAEYLKENQSLILQRTVANDGTSALYIAMRHSEPSAAN